MAKNSRILMLTPFFSPNVGGVETHLDDLTGYLATNWCPVQVITYQPLTAKIKARVIERKRNLTIFRLPWLKLNLFYKFESKPLLQFLYLFPGIFFFALIYLIFNFRKITNIHGHGLSAGVATLILSKLFFKKGILSLHTIYKFSERPLLAAIVKRLLLPLDKIMVLAQGCKDDLIKIGIPAEKISVYTCWVDNRNVFYKRDKEDCRKRLELPQDKFLLLFIARLTKEKGVNIILEIIKQTKIKDAVFVIVGDGPMRDEVERAASISGNVITTGSVPYEFLKIYYSAADILLFGSVDQDYYGRVTMEALSCGLPVILPESTSYFGRAAKVRINFPQNEIGFLVPPKAEEIVRILNGITATKAISGMSIKAREFALENFSVKNASVFVNVYQSCNAF